MRRTTEIVSQINRLFLLSTLLLIAIYCPQPLEASLYDNVSIVDIEPVNDATHSHRLRLLLGSREETALLNESDTFRSTSILTISNGVATSGDLTDLAIFQGQIENVQNSWVRLVIRGTEVSGIVDTGDERIHLNHALSADLTRQAKTGVFRPFNQKLTEPMVPGDLLDTGDIVEIDIGAGFFNKPEKVTKVASIAIVIDSAYDEAIGGRGLAQAISTINAVDGIYREEFGLALQVETAIMVTDDETLALGNISLQDNLTRFRDYRMISDQIGSDLSMVHLFTGVTTADPSVGLAYIDTVCRTNGYDVSLSLPFRYPILLTAHEIGHNLGAIHDDETSQCNDAADRLMFSHINENSTRAFSNCSIDAISKRLEESTCHADAIDMEITLARQDDTGIIALITNTDAVRAFPSATLAIQLDHATIAAAPASCDVISDQSVQCSVDRTFAEESQSLNFDLRLEEGHEITIAATLEPEGFVDVHNLNNTDKIVIPQVVVTTQSDANDDIENPGVADATDGSMGVPETGGGGSAGILETCLTLLMFLRLLCWRSAHCNQIQRASSFNKSRDLKTSING